MLNTGSKVAFKITGRSPTNPARPEATLRAIMAKLAPTIGNYAKTKCIEPQAQQVARFVSKQFVANGNAINLSKINSIYDNRNAPNRFGGPKDVQRYASLYLGLPASNQLYGSAFMEMAFHKDPTKLQSFEDAKAARQIVLGGNDIGGSALNAVRNYLAIGKVMDDQTCLLRYRRKPNSSLFTLDLDDQQVITDLNDILRPFSKEFMNQLEQATVFKELGRDFWSSYTPDIANRLLTQSAGLDAPTLLLGGMPDYFVPQMFGPIVTNERICLKWKSTRNVATTDAFMDGAANLLLPAEVGYNPSSFELIPESIFTFDSNAKKVERTEVVDGGLLP